MNGNDQVPQSVENREMREESIGNIQRQNNYYLTENIGGKVIIACFTTLMMCFFRYYGIPDNDVHCIDDKVHDYFNPINGFLNNHIIYASILIASSSFLMDLISISTIFYWLIYVRNTRFILAITTFYIIRITNLYMFHMRFPMGYYWTDPQIPSLTVPYGRTSDFFFSGHCGFLSLCFFEWRVIYKSIQEKHNFMRYFKCSTYLFNFICLSIIHFISNSFIF